MKEINIIEKMQKLVKRYTKHYQGDVDFDVANLIKSDKYDESVFIVRECGTNLVSLKKWAEDKVQKTIYDFYVNYPDVRYYFLQVTRKENVSRYGVLKKINDPVAFREEVEKKWGE